MSSRVAIIGAGPSGLAQLRAFKSAADKGAEIPEIVCYEKQDNWGGLWNYTWRTGLDEYGESVHCSMYRYLWSNGPKEGLEFADYSFDEHFGRQIASYPPREVLFDYIEGRVKKAGVRDSIRFRHPVRHVTCDNATGRFSIVAHDLKKDLEYAEEFDHVVVASGHFSTPNAPQFEGFLDFNGRILHAHDFRDAMEFKDKDVLLIGSSYSAEDIGSQCWKYGARSITSSYRTRPMGLKWPANWEEKPLLQRVDSNTAYFADGTSKRVDAIILCTGYLHYFPFMAEELRLRTPNILYPDNLYQGVVWQDNTNLFYLGMQDQWYTFNMFDAQAWYVRDVILGRIALPSLAEMKKHTAGWRAKEAAIEDDYQAIAFQGEHTKSLINLTDYPSFDFDQTNEVFFQWKRHKKADIMDFRNNSYRSVMSGAMAPPHHTPWKDALDDSLQAYLADSSETEEPAKTARQG